MIRVQREDFDLGAELKALTEGNTGIGGIASFVGLVRDTAKGAPISSMTLDYYPGMTERELERIEAEAQQRWPLDAVLVIHRHGKLLPGDQIVLVITASAHRKAAFESCEFIMDFLKTRAPFWKKEADAGGEGTWVDAKDSDDGAAARWQSS